MKTEQIKLPRKLSPAFFNMLLTHDKFVIFDGVLILDCAVYARRIGLQFLDSAGNMYSRDNKHFIFTAGQKRL